MNVTIFSQDGVVYTAISHRLPPKELAKLTAQSIRDMAKVPHSEMHVVTVEEFRTMPFDKPKKTP